MAIKLFKNNFIVGVTSGLVAAVIAPMLVPAIKRGSRPMAKGLIKGGMLLYEKGREATAHAGEMIEDVMAEIHAEQAEKQAAAATGEEWEEENFSAENNGGGSQGKPAINEGRTNQNQAKQHGTAPS